jgi:SAM-dependent methyltransferase
MDKSTSAEATDESRHSRAADMPSLNEAVVDATEVYALGSSSGESARLQRQAEELAPDSAVLLDRVGLRAGDRAIDLGCGPRGALDLLAERVSPGGRVVGLDADPTHVAMANAFVANLDLSDVEIVCADARRTGLRSGSFDLVHARTLLIIVPDPAEVLAEMVRLARPGGWVAGLEWDTEAAICYPPHPAFDRLCEIFTMAFSRNGADPHIGRRMAELYRQVGLENVMVAARAGVYPPGHSRRTIRADLVRSMRPQILEMDCRMSGSSTSLTPQPARISRIRTLSSCPACISSLGVARRPPLDPSDRCLARWLCLTSAASTGGKSGFPERSGQRILPRSSQGRDDETDALVPGNDRAAGSVLGKTENSSHRDLASQDFWFHESPAASGLTSHRTDSSPPGRRARRAAVTAAWPPRRRSRRRPAAPVRSGRVRCRPRAASVCGRAAALSGPAFFTTDDRSHRASH